MKFRSIFIAVLCGGLMMAVPVYAQQTNLEAQQKSVRSAEKSMKETRDAMIKAASASNANQKKLDTLEKKIATAEAEQQSIHAKLQNNYGNIAGLIGALERIRRMPPELLVLKPGAPLDTARSAMLMQDILPLLGTQAGDLSKDLTRLDQLQKSLESDRAQAMTSKKSLDEEYRKVASLTEKREALYKRANLDYEKAAQQAAEAARQADNAHDLVARLDRAPDVQHTPRPNPSGNRPPTGRFVVPVAGSIATGYGDRNDLGAASEGVEFAARPSSIVVSPLGGTVKFAGEFRNYGRMVIVEHRGGYHSLIGGLGALTVAVGQDVGAGEPVGKLPSTPSRGRDAALYYELRYKGRPIDPSSKFAGLKS